MQSSRNRIIVTSLRLLLLLAASCTSELSVAEEGAATSLSEYSVSVEPYAPVGEIGGVRVHWRAPRDHYSLDMLRIYPVGAPDGEGIMFGYVGGANESAGITELTLDPKLIAGPRDIEVRYQERYSIGETVATSNVVTLVAPYALDIDPIASSGRSVTLQWQAPRQHYAGDWVGLYEVGAGDENYLAYQLLYGRDQRSGVVNFTLPPASVDPGPYEFRMFIQDIWYRVAVAGPIHSAE